MARPRTVEVGMLSRKSFLTQNSKAMKKRPYAKSKAKYSVPYISTITHKVKVTI